MTEAGPLITIIMATMNGVHALPRCLASVAGQTYSRRELIVMDGGSTDGTVDILASTPSVVTYWESSPDRGIAHAWNKALSHARGEWICFLGADDYFWTPTILERVAQTLTSRRPTVLVVHGQVALVNDQGEVLEVVGTHWTGGRGAVLRSLSLPHQAVFHHASIFQVFGRFDESFRITADYDLLVRVLGAADAEFLPEVITGMEVGGISSSTHSEVNHLRERARVWRKNDLARVPPPGWWWTYLKARTRVVFRRGLGEPAAHRLFDLYRQITGRSKYWTHR